ncbi:MAG: hypothetical protein OEV78_11085 [Spirochaetia bacterium]|nr:hypothetical protein [Spirochaetia bacterium]
MLTEAVAIGAVISFISLIVNRKVVRMYSVSTNMWNGWITAMIFRFLGIIFSAVYLVVSEMVRQKPVNETFFMLIVLLVIVLGLFVDLFLSILKIQKVNEKVNG